MNSITQSGLQWQPGEVSSLKAGIQNNYELY